MCKWQDCALLLDAATLPPPGCSLLHSRQQGLSVIYFFTALLTNFAVIFKFFWISANLIAANGISGHRLNCISLIMRRIEHLFTCFRAICISLFVNHLYLLSQFSSRFLETHTLSCLLPSCKWYKLQTTFPILLFTFYFACDIFLLCKF